MTTGSRILPRLYQGPIASVLPPEFTMIVFCAEELQPPDHVCGRLRVVRCPLRDDSRVALGPAEIRAALNAAAVVCAEHARGGRIYVSCAMGINRSGLVMAFAVRSLLGLRGVEALRWVQERRPGSLTNTDFQQVLTRMGAPESTARRRLELLG